MSFKRDLLLIALYSTLIAWFISRYDVSKIPGVEFSFSDLFETAASSFIAISFIYIQLTKLLTQVNNNFGTFAVWCLAYLILLILYLISWFITEIGRSFIKDWGTKGGPNLGILTTWGHCTQANILYIIAWWLCPINHRPITNLVYNFNLMRFWPFTIVLILIVGIIPGAILSSHYQDVLQKIVRNYPYR